MFDDNLLSITTYPPTPSPTAPLPPPLPFPHPLLPLIRIRLLPLLPLDLRNKPLVLLLILSIPLLLLPQILPRDEIGIFPEFPQSALAFALVLRFQLAELGAVAVGVVVFVRVVGFFEFGNGGFDGEGAVVVEVEGKAVEAGLLCEALEFGMGCADLVLCVLVSRGDPT